MSIIFSFAISRMVNENLYRISFLAFLMTFGRSIITNAQDVEDNYCYALDDNPYWSFGSTTPYDFVRSPEMDVPDHNACEPVYIWGVVRSGVRNFMEYDVRQTDRILLQAEIVNNHEKEKRGKLHPIDLENLKKWTNYDPNKRFHLMPRGREESYNLGKRLADKFKDLVADQSENIRVYRMGDTRLVKDSAESFFKGMFGDLAKIDTPEVDDEVFQHENDLAFLDAESYANATEKKNQCFRSDPMKTLQKEVSLRLGYNENSFSHSLIKTVYGACCMEFAWTSEIKPAFCAAFTKSQLQLMEYCEEEITGYYKIGYGSKFAVELSRRMFNDLVSKFEAASKSEDFQFHGEITFAQNPALVILILKLGLYNDEEPLPVDNPDATRNQRKWSMTKIDPFNGNVLIMLQKCGNGELKVSAYHNEELIQIPGCSSKLCPWSEFKKVLEMRSIPENFEGEA